MLFYLEIALLSFADQNNKRVTDEMLSISCEKLWPKDSTPSALPTLALS